MIIIKKDNNIFLGQAILRAVRVLLESSRKGATTLLGTPWPSVRSFTVCGSGGIWCVCSVNYLKFSYLLKLPHQHCLRAALWRHWSWPFYRNHRYTFRRMFCFFEIVWPQIVRQKINNCVANPSFELFPTSVYLSKRKTLALSFKSALKLLSLFSLVCCTNCRLRVKCPQLSFSEQFVIWQVCGPLNGQLEVCLN